MDYTGKKVVVLGMGETGLSAARWLHARGAEVRVADSREKPPHLDKLRDELTYAEIFTGPFNENTFADCDLAVISPGVPLATPAIVDAMAGGLPVVGDVELFAQTIRGWDSKIIAITGAISLYALFGRKGGKVLSSVVTENKG